MSRPPSALTIRANAAPKLAGNFVTMDLRAVRRAFESVPWVRQAVVNRASALQTLAMAHLAAIEACHSVAGEENYILKARVRTPGDLETLLAKVRAAANVATRTTVVLSTPWE